MDIYSILFILFSIFLAILSIAVYLISKEIHEIYTHLLSLTKRIKDIENK